LREEIAEGKVDLGSLKEDLDMIAESAAQIIQVKEQLIGAVREQKPHAVLFVDALQTAARQRDVPGAMLKLKIDPAAAYVVADSTQLVRALGNILQNAVEAGAKSVTVNAHTIEERGMLVINIEDDGAGMSEGIMQKAWSPFFTTRGPGHHGLGLPAAMHVISQAQGRIALVSEEEKGTTVAIFLPQGRVDDGALKTGSVKNVLLFDDNDDWANHFAGLLKGMGVKLIQTTDFKKFPTADLILVDEHIASVPLLDVLSALSKAGLASKTVILTAAINPERVTQFLRHGAKDVQVKPYSNREVSELLK
jgi:CheY-like chemotaxis protein